jgi:nucleoside-diphosphate-sugar epimerase
MRLAITGAGGVLGRNVLFEFIKQHARRPDGLELLLLGRDKGQRSHAERMRRILLGDGADYLAGDSADRGALGDMLRERVRCVEMDLGCRDLGIAAEGLAALRDAPIDVFLHAAALTDLRTTPAARAAVMETNVAGTRRLLQLVERLDVKQLCYVGSAYCCGATTGRIMPDQGNPLGDFRNPYEESKLLAEQEVRAFAQRTGVRCRCFRPSIICGRLMEAPRGGISKFGVFYAVAAFLLRMKRALLPAGADVLGEPVRLDLRACCNTHSSLNIVPADYCAKVICQTIRQDAPGESYHLVNDRPVRNADFFRLMRDALRCEGIKPVRRVPMDMDRVEALYYKTVGGIFTPYVLSEPMFFDTSSVAPVLRQAGLACPPVDDTTFPVLMDYAKAHMFGLNGDP